MLGNGDQVIALINGGTKSMVMKATLENIFSGQSVMGPTSNIDQAWDIYDLWGDRLSDGVASNIMSGTASPGKYLYNVTQTSYAEGLANNNPMLFGKKIGTVQSEGTVTANVPAHGIAFYRLRPSS
jgi:alpha-galactosidase